MIVPISNENRTQVNESIKKEWSGPLIISKGVSHDSSKQDGFASITNGMRIYASLAPTNRIISISLVRV